MIDLTQEVIWVSGGYTPKPPRPVDREGWALDYLEDPYSQGGEWIYIKIKEERPTGYTGDDWV